MPVALWEANLLLSPIIHHLARHIVDKVRERVQFTCISFRISSQHMIYVAHVLLLTILRKTLIFISADLWNRSAFSSFNLFLFATTRLLVVKIYSHRFPLTLLAHTHTVNRSHLFNKMTKIGFHSVKLLRMQLVIRQLCFSNEEESEDKNYCGDICEALMDIEIEIITYVHRPI